MRKMKRILCVCLATVLPFFLMACTGSSGGSTAASTAAPAEASTAAEEVSVPADADSDSVSASVTLWTYPVGKWVDPETVDALIASFNEQYPDIEVNVAFLDYAEGDDKVNEAIENNAAPDIIFEGPERLVANWGAKGLMVDLSDMFADSAAGDIYENVRAACKGHDGNYYEYPLCMVAHCMAINKTIFEESDALQYVNLDNHTWTTEDFFKAVQAIYDSGHEDVAIIYCGGQGGDQGTRAIINNLYSGTYTDADHTAYTADSAENIRAIEELYAQDGIRFDPDHVANDEIAMLRDNTLAMAFCWNAGQHNTVPEGLDEAGYTNAGDEIIPMNFPTDNGKVELCGGIWGFGIFDNGDADKIEAAKLFINYMANENMKEAVLASGQFPTHANATGVFTGSETEDVMAMFTKDFMPNLGDYYQVVPGWANARTEWWNMLQRVGKGGDVATEVATFVENANAAANR